MIIDSHCHLNKYKDDLNIVLERARTKGIKGFVTINTKLEEASEIQLICEQHPDVFCAIGVHPSEATHNPDLISEIQKYCQHRKVVALGETGLDYFYGLDKKSLQIESFEAHVEVSNLLKLPLVVHTRDAEEATLSILRHCKNQNPGIIHCFTGTYEFAAKAIDLGFMISFSGIITFKNADTLRSVLQKIPMESILIETDAPWLTPEPLRSIKRNEPGFIVHTAMKVAEIKCLTLDEVAQITTMNCTKVFTNKILLNHKI